MTTGTARPASSTRSSAPSCARKSLSGEIDAYACGPPPMIDAVLPVLQMNGVEPDHIYFDKFTPAVR